MEVSTVGGVGIFHCFHQLQLSRIHHVEAFMRFHMPLHTYTYFNEYHELPAASTRLPDESTNFRSIYFRESFHHLHGSRWKNICFHVNFLVSWWKHIYFHGMFVEASMEKHGSFHCRWKYLRSSHCFHQSQLPRIHTPWERP